MLQLGAELAMLQDFMDNHLFQGSRKLLFISFLMEKFFFLPFKFVASLEINRTKLSVLYLYIGNFKISITGN